MPEIITIGFPGGPAWGDGGVVGFGSPLSAEDVPALAEVVRSGIEREGHVVALYPSWAAEPSTRRLATVRSALETGRVATYGVALPPLAGAVFARLAAAVATYIPSPGVLLSGLPRLERELIVVAWLSSVSRLRHPAPSVWQHARSWAPGSAFGAVLWPRPVVRRLHRRDRTLPLSLPDHPIRLVVSSRDGDLAWAREVVVPALGDPPTKEVPATDEGAAWWGSRRLVEVVGYPVDVPGLAGRISLGVEGTVCWWCDETVATDPCPFCGLNARLAGVGGAE
jgi:hypothetical protein